MKKLMLVFVFVCLSLPSLGFSEAVKIPRSINGFRGIKWGTVKGWSELKRDFCYMPTMDEQTKAGPDHEIWYYSRYRDSNTIGAATVRKINYGFWRNGKGEMVFCRVRLKAEGEENAKNLFITFKEVFGNPTKAPSGFISGLSLNRFWNLEYTKIGFKYYKGFTVYAEVWLISKKVEEQIENFVKEQTKGAEKDF